MKPKLKLNKKDIRNAWTTLGMTELLTYLAESGLFDVEYHDERIGAMKGQRASLILYNDKRVYLDLWEYATPCYTPVAYNSNLDLVIKLQHKDMDVQRYERSCKRKRILRDLTPEQRAEYFEKIVPWTFFASRMMKQFIGHEDELEKLPDERIGFFCGKGWKCRGKAMRQLESKIEFVRSSQEKKRGRPLKDEDYIHKMRTSKYGICLHGRGSHLTEAKNRREIDYMMLKKPLVMNYKPNYYNPLVEGKHYIYLDENLDLENIEKLYNVEEIAQNGYEWYKENASPMGAAKTFLQIMNDRFGE